MDMKKNLSAIALITAALQLMQAEEAQATFQEDTEALEAEDPFYKAKMLMQIESFYRKVIDEGHFREEILPEIEQKLHTLNVVLPDPAETLTLSIMTSQMLDCLYVYCPLEKDRIKQPYIRFLRVLQDCMNNEHHLLTNQEGLEAKNQQLVYFLKSMIRSIEDDLNA